ncbi:MAG: outer membrane protein transport protein [Flavobacteriaceae bacterium]|nr:outer membrane protein transport protein [Flavobacteriaceae bacterium]
MKNYFLTFSLLFASFAVFAQAGHIMQGVGSVNMSMGGASTAQPLDISGALQWNPASISTFDEKILKFDLGLFFSSPALSSTFGPLSGTTEDDRPLSPMPAFAMVWGKADSKHTFGASAFGISGFGVTFPANNNYPQDLQGNPNPNFDPTEPVNPINFPQFAGGFGRIESDYILLQIGFTWAYELSDTFSFGVEPTINYATLELAPNPISSPSQTLGYPTSDKATAIGFGAQFGLFYDSGTGFKAGASYKTAQSFSDFDFKNTYLDGSSAPDASFNMDYPAIMSLGLGYSKGDIDLALDYRMVDYENTDGFEASGWTPTASVAGFGWENISILSAGIQYKGIDKLPLRLGYTYSSNPITEELAFFSMPATAIIKNAFQFGFSYEVNDNFTLDAVYHFGDSGDATSGSMLNPMAITQNDPLGVVPGTSVSYDMTTSMIMVGFSYKFNKKEAIE